MKKLILFPDFFRIRYYVVGQVLLVPYLLFSQNVGIGTSAPSNKLSVVGNLVVTPLTTATSNAPTPAQTKTMINGTTISFLQADSTGRIYDPGGPAGNYIANLNAVAFVYEAPINSIGIEVIFEEFNLGTGDSLLISDGLGPTANILLAIGNGFTNSGSFILNSFHLYFTFKSNVDANVGTGFSILFRKLFGSIAEPVKNVFDRTFFFDVTKAAIRAGWLNISPIGEFSTAMGLWNEASGNSSTAMGSSSKARGQSSTALGNNCLASGNRSIAMGNGSVASGSDAIALGGATHATSSNSVAMGANTTASGSYSTAIGWSTIASGALSFAAGSEVNTNLRQGSFAFGDSDPTNQGETTVGLDNQFVCRFRGGYYFLTSGNNIATRTGVLVVTGGNSWSAVSDVRLKENFLPVDGESFLKKLSLIPQYTWNYKGQDSKTFRHYGPMAQDFYNAFGTDNLGSIGCDTLINQQDFLGVNLIAIQALERRTQLLQIENEELNKRIKLLETDKDKIESLQEQLQMLEKQLKNHYLKIRKMSREKN